MAQVISKDEVIIDDKVSINVTVQKKLTSESVAGEEYSKDFEEKQSDPPFKPSGSPGEVVDLEVPEVNDKSDEIIEDNPLTPRSTPNSNDDWLQQQAADMIEQVISAASQKVEIELPELLTENILQLNRNHSSEKLEASVETEAEPGAEPEAEPEVEPEVEPEAEDESLSAATSTETVVETSTAKGIF